MGNITSPLKARPTIYKGIEMRSRLEALWAAEFDVLAEDEGAKWEYEPVCFASPNGQYLPDFRITWPNMAGCIYVEIRPFMGDPEPTMRRMEAILDSEFDPESSIHLRLIAGKPTDDYKEWECSRMHPLSWYEWYDNGGDISPFERKVPEPPFLAKWREDYGFERWAPEMVGGK